MTSLSYSETYSSNAMSKYLLPKKSNKRLYTNKIKDGLHIPRLNHCTRTMTLPSAQMNTHSSCGSDNSTHRAIASAWIFSIRMIAWRDSSLIPPCSTRLISCCAGSKLFSNGLVVGDEDSIGDDVASIVAEVETDIWLSVRVRTD